jgi:hypothetical protein
LKALWDAVIKHVAIIVIPPEKHHLVKEIGEADQLDLSLGPCD